MTTQIKFTRHAVNRYWERVLGGTSGRRSKRSVFGELRSLAAIVAQVADEAPRWATSHASTQRSDRYFIPSADVVFPVLSNGDDWVAVTCLTRSMSVAKA